MSRLPFLLSIIALLGATVLAVLFFRISAAKKIVEAELAGTTARAVKLESDLAVATKENDTLKTGLAAATAELTATRERLSASEQHVSALNRDLAQANDKLAVYEQASRALTEEVASLKAELADAHANFAPPEAVAAYKNTIAELERELANARNGAAAPAAAGASTAVFASRPGRATVLNVGPSNAFVVLDYGTVRGAQLGQKIEISQGTEVVAEALISDVRTNFSIAQVQPDTLRGVLQKGDLAVLIR